MRSEVTEKLIVLYISQKILYGLAWEKKVHMPHLRKLVEVYARLHRTLDHQGRFSEIHSQLGFSLSHKLLVKNHWVGLISNQKMMGISKQVSSFLQQEKKGKEETPTLQVSILPCFLLFFLKSSSISPRNAISISISSSFHLAPVSSSSSSSVFNIFPFDLFDAVFCLTGSSSTLTSSSFLNSLLALLRTRHVTCHTSFRRSGPTLNIKPMGPY